MYTLCSPVLYSENRGMQHFADTHSRPPKTIKKGMYQYDTDAPAQGPSSPGNKHFAKIKLKKGHISNNNWWNLPYIELELYFLIVYLYIKYRSNTLIFSKDIERGNRFRTYGRDVRSDRRTDISDTICRLPLPIENVRGIKIEGICGEVYLAAA